jgi:hypothetical protein
MLGYSVYVSVIGVDIASGFAVLEDEATLAGVCFNGFMRRENFLFFLLFNVARRSYTFVFNRVGNTPSLISIISSIKAWLRRLFASRRL